MRSILVVGTLAYDDVRSGGVSRERVLGGSAWYFAMAASLFAPVRIVSVVGEDFADEARLTRRSVDLGGVERQRGRTLRWSADYDASEERRVNSDPGVLANWRPHVPDAWRASELVCLGAVPPENERAAQEALTAAQLVMADTAGHWIADARGTLREVFARSDVVSLNEREAALVTLAEDPAGALLALGPRAVVLKRGAGGATLRTPRISVDVPAFPVRRVVDPTGAGDALAGGFLGRLAERDRLDDDAFVDALAYGVACASLAIESFGVDALEAADHATVESRRRALVHGNRAAPRL